MPDSPLPPLHILVAEDNLINQRLVLEVLKRIGYSASVAANGLEAVSAVVREPMDLIFMDVNMPEMDGLEATRQIRQRIPVNGPVIVAMTAGAMQDDRLRCSAAGMDDYLAKPFRFSDLRALIEKWNGKFPSQTAAPSEVPPPTGYDQNIEPFLQTLVEESDAAFAVEFLETFCSLSATQLADLVRAVADRDAPRIILAAHSLKGGSAAVGSNKLAGACLDLELRAKANDIDGATALLENVRDAFHPTIAQIGEVVSRLRSGEPIS
jgi:CheY-like chemotaxis protein